MYYLLRMAKGSELAAKYEVDTSSNCGGTGPAVAPDAALVTRGVRTA
jgi:hypothetical protein